MNKIKNLTIGFLLFALILCASLLIVEKRRPVPEPEKTESKAVELDAKIIARKVDKQGIEHVILEETNRVTGMNDLSLEAKIEIDSLAKLIEIKDKQLREYYATNMQLKTGLLKAEESIDSINQRTFTYSDSYINAKFFNTDTADYFDFSYNAELSHIKYWKRDKLLGMRIGAKRNYIDIFSNDPRMTISGAKHLVIEDRESPWTFRAGGSALYVPHADILGYGPKVSVDYLGLGVNAQYLYFPESKEWNPIFNVYYDLLRW